MCGYYYTEKLSHIGKCSDVRAFAYCVVSPRIVFCACCIYSGWRENQKEGLCSGQGERKKKRRDDTTSIKKKLWRFCLTRFKRNLKRKKEVNLSGSS